MGICIVPRWSGGPSHDWYPWFADRVSPQTIEVVPLRPSPDAPAIDACIDELARALKDRILEQTVLVGHSVGCQALLRYLAKAPESVRVGALVCVAGWWWVDEPWDTIRPWIETPLDEQAVRRAAPSIRVLLSDNDPFTADHESNAEAWRQRVGAKVVIAPGRAHFNAAEEPDVLRVVTAALDSAPRSSGSAV